MVFSFFLFLAGGPQVSWAQDALPTGTLPPRGVVNPPVAVGQPGPPQGGQEVWTGYLNEVYRYLGKDKDSAPRTVPGVPSR